VIDKLTITNFKAFGSAEIRLAPYTLLSGLNSSGKSTVLQALALLRQSFDQGLLLSLDDGGFPLNGELTQLGTGQDVLHEDYVTPAGEQPQIGFQLSASNILNEWQGAYGREDDLLPLTICSPTAKDLALDMAVTGKAPAEAGSAFTIFNEGFQYLRADRINPAVTYPRSHEMSVRRRFLGARGEYAIDFLRTYQDEVVTFEALLHGGPSPRLLDQTEAWMSEICPGVRMQARAIEQTDLVRLGFQFSRKGQLTSDLRRPTNVGFGLTYALPIVLACLTARPGSMILLENPEAHVHPQGQSAMGRLTCAAAAIGAQLVVETHSDHILNGVRLEVKRGALSPDDVALHYFRREDDGVRIVSPAIGPDGMLSEWPEGFFDEWDRSLDQLLD
jgi:predicted ATPase